MNLYLIENIKLALTAIHGHLLRTILTILIIAIGIMALIGILTATESIKNSVSSNFTQMGANTFTIKNVSFRSRGANKSNKAFSRITYQEAEDFKERFEFPSTISVYSWASGMATLKYKSEKTNPNIGVLGIDENYLECGGFSLAKGRNISSTEMFFGSSVVILGSELESTLFKNNEDPLDKEIRIGALKYKVIGVLNTKGSSMGMSGDKDCYIPLSNVRNYFAHDNMFYNINVMVNSSNMLDPAIGEATGLFRIIRKVPLGQEDDFSITKSDNLAQMLLENIGKVTSATAIIGFITLLGAAIGLMNIMLVSVTERTREIGIRKATGATRKTIRNQFLIEAIVIGVLGGIFGIIFGVLAGNLVSLLTKGTFIVPWLWVLSGIGLCILVGLISGIYPANRAAKLDPIESLRFE